jgi:23S rRNA (uracil1939-C5)-methyltransferase
VICRHFGVCGGCTSQDVSYERQLADKAAALSALLARFVARPADSWPTPLVIPMPVGRDGMLRGFRRKVAFVFGPGPHGKGLVMGHYARGSQHVVPIGECPVHSDRGNRMAFALRDRLARAGVSAAGRSGHGILRHLIVRATADDSEAVAMLVVTRNDKALRSPIRALLDSAERPDGFLLNIHDRSGPFMVGPKTLRIAGREHVRERLHGATFLVSPAAFFQTNTQAAEALQSLVLAGVESSMRVLALYAGSGLFTVPLALKGVQVMAIEENRQAVTDAERNVRLNRIAAGRVRLVCARVEDALPRAAREPWDGVVLDPPRQGCSPAVLTGVFERIAARVVVYVSCNPDVLATELPSIVAAGYRINRLQAVDMFPYTDHIETVVQLLRD